MFEDRPENKNLKTTIINGKYISSALVWRSIPFTEGWIKTYETYVWEYDSETKERGEWVHESYQRSEKQCLEEHDELIEQYK